MPVMRKAVFVAAIGSLAVGIAASPASAAAGLTVRDPYPVPQSTRGVPDADAIDITAAGLSPGLFVYANFATARLPVRRTGQRKPTADRRALRSRYKQAGRWHSRERPELRRKVWHGDNANDTNLGEQQFNCLAPDDNPGSAVTTDGGQPIDSREPAWGSSKGRDSAGGGPAPCQIRVTTSLGVYSSSDLFDPINLTATGAANASGSGGSGSGASSGSTGAASSSGASTVAAWVPGVRAVQARLAARVRRAPPARERQAATRVTDRLAEGCSGGPLAQTGAEIAGLLVIVAVALVVAGIFLVRMSRRRRDLQRT